MVEQEQVPAIIESLLDVVAQLQEFARGRD